MADQLVSMLFRGSLAVLISALSFHFRADRGCVLAAGTMQRDTQDTDALALTEQISEFKEAFSLFDKGE